MDGRTTRQVTPPVYRRSRRWFDTDSVNTRDIGGLPVTRHRRIRPGVVFRADAGVRAVPSVALHLSALHGRAQVLDLRDAEEVADSDPPPSGVIIHRFPLSDPARPYGRPAIRDPEYFASQYLEILPLGFAAAGQLLGHLAQDSAPLVVACRMGKDRTGVVVMVLLAALGVPQRWIVRDFALTARCYLANPDWVARYAASRHEDPRVVMRRLVLPPSIARRTVVRVFEQTRGHDKWPGLLGVNRFTIDRAVDRLVYEGEPA